MSSRRVSTLALKTWTRDSQGNGRTWIAKLCRSSDFSVIATFLGTRDWIQTRSAQTASNLTWQFLVSMISLIDPTSVDDGSSKSLAQIAQPTSHTGDI